MTREARLSRKTSLYFAALQRGDAPFAAAVLASIQKDAAEGRTEAQARTRAYLARRH